MSAHDRKAILLATFRRKGGKGQFTDEYDLLSNNDKSSLQRLVQLDSDEVPVIACTYDEDNWLVITTARVIWSVLGKRTEITHGDIRDANPVRLKDFGVRPKAKTDMNELLILARGGSEHVVRIEPGLPFFGVWHVLKNIGARSRNQPLNTFDS